ncbi:hypothetical protein N7510_009458 [Penicillium lagena]|uniref:uncharacterized protein n=1 Tax=Penicillium lagena TaxID=94218 RepID=UPI002541CB7C|nr:uncharacterized protein N7510_009458 [Penicillium lagena]KAJ5606677.1 hypothetical protein N7510_009458 [Penicillium lagena]
MLSPQSTKDVGLHGALDVDQAILQGMNLLQEIGDHSQPLAFRPSDTFTLFAANATNGFGLPPRSDDHPIGDFAMSGESLLEIENMFYSTGWANLMEV